MVKVGFIVEGTSDFIILKSDKFQNLLKYRLQISGEEGLIRIAHNRSFLMVNLIKLMQNLEKEDVDQIFILVDQDGDDCPQLTKSSIIDYRDNSHYINSKHVFIIMTHEMEAWFLADIRLGYEFAGLPEEIRNPSEIIERKERTTNHIVIAKRVADIFSLERAAKNAPSAKRFLNKLEQISPEIITQP